MDTNYFDAENEYYNAKYRGDTLAAIRWAIVLDTFAGLEL